LISKRRYFIWLAVISFTLGANSRPNVALISLSIALILVFLSGRRQKWYLYLDHVCLALIPLLTMLSVFWLKFHALIPSLTMNIQVPESPHWKEIYELNGGKSSGIEFIPSNFFAYFRIDPINLNGGFLELLHPNPLPFVYLWPLRQGSMHIESSFSLTVLAPFALCLILFYAVNFLWSKSSKTPSSQLNSKKNLPRNMPLNWMIFAACAGTIVTLTFVGNSQRYLVDFAPFLIITSLAGLRYLNLDSRSKYKTTYLTMLLLLSIFGTVMNLLVTINQKNIWSI
jgi:hypothetical protein